MPKRSNSNSRQGEEPVGLSTEYLISILRFKLEIFKKRSRHSSLNGEIITYVTSKHPELSVTDVQSWIASNPWIIDPNEIPPKSIGQHEELMVDERDDTESSPSPPQKKRPRKAKSKALSIIKKRKGISPKSSCSVELRSKRHPSTITSNNSRSPTTIPQSKTKIRTSPRLASNSTPSPNYNIVKKVQHKTNTSTLNLVQQDPRSNINTRSRAARSSSLAMSSNGNTPPVATLTSSPEENNELAAISIQTFQLDEVEEKEEIFPGPKENEQLEQGNMESERPFDKEEINLPFELEFQKSLGTIINNEDQSIPERRSITNGEFSNDQDQVQHQLPELMTTLGENYNFNWPNDPPEPIMPVPIPIPIVDLTYPQQTVNNYPQTYPPPPQFSDNDDADMSFGIEMNKAMMSKDYENYNGSELQSHTSKSSNSSYYFCDGGRLQEGNSGFSSDNDPVDPRNVPLQAPNPMTDLPPSRSLTHRPQNYYEEQQKELEIQKQRLHELCFKFEDLLHIRYNLSECEISGGDAWPNWNTLIGNYQGYLNELKEIIFDFRSD